MRLDSDEFDVSVNHDEKLVIFHLRDDLPEHDIADLLIGYYQNRPEIWAYNRVLDVRQWNGYFNFSTLESLSLRWHQLAGPNPPPAKVAVLTHDRYESSRAKTVAPLFPNDLTGVFETMADAQTWMKAEANVVPQHESSGQPADQ